MSTLATANKLMSQGKYAEAAALLQSLIANHHPLRKHAQFNLSLIRARLATDATTSAPKCSPNAHLDEYTKLYIDPLFRLQDVFGTLNDYSFLLHDENITTRKLPSVAIIAFSNGIVSDYKHFLDSLMEFCDLFGRFEITIPCETIDQLRARDILIHEYKGRLELFLHYEPGPAGTERAALNNAARAARCDALVFADPRTAPPRAYFQAIARIFRDTSRATIVPLWWSHIKSDSCNIQCAPSEDPSSTREAAGSTLDEHEQLHLQKWLNYIFPYDAVSEELCCISKSAFDSLGGFREEIRDTHLQVKEFFYRFYCTGGYFVPCRMPVLSSAALDRPSKSGTDGHRDEDAFQWIADIRRPRDCPVKTTPLFSVYVPAYNAERYIDECVQSVLDQSFTDFEVLIINDGSTDTTAERLKKYAFDPRVHVFHTANNGIGSASNLALKQASGYYIVQLDSDDRLAPDALESLYKFYQDQPSAECVYTNHTLIDAHGHHIGEGWSPASFDRYRNLMGLSVPHLRSYTRRVFFKTSGFDPYFLNAVDYDFFLKVADVAFIHHLDQSLYFYRVHHSRTSTKHRDAQLANHSAVVDKYLKRHGFDEFYARAMDPFHPQRNYILKKGSPLEQSLVDRHFEGGIKDITFPDAKFRGNDYTFIQNHIDTTYSNGSHKYTEKVSIVVPVYNRFERLARCLAGICLQTYPLELIEVVVVDDGSSDDVIQVLSKYSSRLDLKYTKQTDLGYRLSAARNLGIRASTHPNVSIIDCDLIPLPRFIESFMRYLHHFENVILLGHQRCVSVEEVSDDDIFNNPSVLDTLKDIKSENRTLADRDSKVTVDWRYDLYAKTNFLKEDPFPYRAFSSGHVAFKKSVIEEAGLYDESFTVWGCEDNEAGYRLYQNGNYFVPVLEAVDLHQEPPNGVNETDRIKDRKQSRILLQQRVPAMRGWFGSAYTLRDQDTPMVSICIPTYNSGRYLSEAIQSAINQSFADFEILVFDDSSDDGSVEKAEELFSDFPRLRFIKGQGRRNIANSRDRLLRLARGEFIGFLDADDTLEPECVEECVSAMRAHPTVGLVNTLYTFIDESGHQTQRGWRPDDISRKRFLYGNIFTHFRFFRMRDLARSRRWSAQDIAAYDNYAEDWDLCLRVMEVAEHFRIDKYLYKYRVGTASITASLNWEAKSSKTRLMLQNWLDHLGMRRIKVISPNRTHPSIIGFIDVF